MQFVKTRNFLLFYLKSKISKKPPSFGKRKKEPFFANFPKSPLFKMGGLPPPPLLHLSHTIKNRFDELGKKRCSAFKARRRYLPDCEVFAPLPVKIVKFLI